MYDLKYINPCNHRITSEELKITNALDENNVIIPGVYIAKSEFNIVPIKAQTFIRSYNAEQSYFQDNSVSYISHLNYAYKTIPNTINYTEIPVAGLIKEIGITNYEFTGKKQITFGKVSDPCTDIDINPELVPANRYFIDYYIDPAECPLCFGTGYVQDIGYNTAGEIAKATGHTKLTQRVLKTLLTKLGTSPEDGQYGSSLNSFIGSNIDVALTISMQKAIYEAVQYVIELQNGLSLTPEETCMGIYSIDVNTDKILENKVVLTLIILDGNGEQVPCSVVLKV